MAKKSTSSEDAHFFEDLHNMLLWKRQNNEQAERMMVENFIGSLNPPVKNIVRRELERP